jgi:hypothetical protein
MDGYCTPAGQSQDRRKDTVKSAIIPGSTDIANDTLERLIFLV